MVKIKPLLNSAVEEINRLSEWSMRSYRIRLYGSSVLSIDISTSVLVEGHHGKSFIPFINDRGRMVTEASDIAVKQPKIDVDSIPRNPVKRRALTASIPQ